MPTTSPGAVSAAASMSRATPKSISLARTASPGDQHVLGLDVSVDDAAGVGVVERLAEIGTDLADLAVAERALADQRVEGRAVDELGDEQGAAVLLTHLVERDYPRVIEPRRGLRLAQHPPDRRRRAESIAFTATGRSSRPSQAS